MTENIGVVKQFISQFFKANLINFECHVSDEFIYNSLLFEDLNFKEYVSYIESLVPHVQFCFGEIETVNEDEFIAEFELLRPNQDFKIETRIKAHKIFKFKNGKINSIVMNYTTDTFAKEKLAEFYKYIIEGQKFIT